MHIIIIIIIIIIDKTRLSCVTPRRRGTTVPLETHSHNLFVLVLFIRHQSCLAALYVLMTSSFCLIGRKLSRKRKLLEISLKRAKRIFCSHLAELCETSGIFTGAMALDLKDRDDKGQDTVKKKKKKKKKKNGRIGRGPPAFYSATA